MLIETVPRVGYRLVVDTPDTRTELFRDGLPLPAALHSCWPLAAPGFGVPERQGVQRTPSV